MSKPPFAKLKSRRSNTISLVDEVYERVLQRILSGELPGGKPISEVELARELKVSRTPVHDAMRQLAKDGLVHQTRNHRAVIAHFTAEDVFEIFEMRILLEGRAAELAAERMPKAEIALLRKRSQELRDGLGEADWASDWADFDEEFHRAIAEGSGYDRLKHDINRYRTLHRGFNKLSTEPSGLRSALAEHEAILGALEARDPNAAKLRMAEHIAIWQDYFKRLFPAA